MGEVRNHSIAHENACGERLSGTCYPVTRTNDLLDTRELRCALGRFATGVAIATTRGVEGPVGLTINSFSSVSLTPPLVLWSLRNDASSLRHFLEAKHYAINVLSVSQRELANRFASKEADKFKGVQQRAGASGVPLLSSCIAQFECRLTKSISCGDHYVLVGEVESAWHRDDQPLIFSSGAYGAATSMLC